MRLAALLLGMLALSGCAFTFIPLVPKPLSLEPRFTVGAESKLERRGSDLYLTLQLVRVPAEGYVSVYLYRRNEKGGEEKIAEDSKLATPDTKALEFRLYEALVGRYRAVVFWQDSVARQFDFELQ